MPDDFYIRPGNYVVPGFGRVNTRQALTDEQKAALYINKNFPFITLKPDGVKILKKVGVTKEQVASLISRAHTTTEVDLLLKVVRKNKVLERIAAVAKHKLEK